MKLGRTATVIVSLMGALTASAAHAAPRSFVTLRDDGTLAGKLSDPDVVTTSVMKAYDATGTPRPEVLSVWTTFPMDKNIIETRFDPISNDVKGIGLESSYGGNGTFSFGTGLAPLRSILLHNDFTQLDKRATSQNAPTEAFARYLFLLELSHNWGPALQLPANDAGVAAGGLIGFDFHWSFWMDAGGSAAGGNAWNDNGDGTFSASGQSPKTIRYSMLDLYLMGLADPAEVPPFGLLVDAVPPADVKDPFSNRPYGPSSFPWFGAAPFTVKASRRVFTIEDVIKANGARVPARSSGALKLGVVLMVGAGTTDEELAPLEAAFEPVASSLAPAFHDATLGRGTLEVVTASDPPDVDAGLEAGVDIAEAGVNPAKAGPGTSSGCAVGPDDAGPLATLSVGLLAAVAALARRRLRASGR
jgi:hypothetical protein